MNVIKLESRTTPLKTNAHCEDKITLLKCPLGCVKCKREVSEINRYYCESDQYQFNNEYHRSIDSLKDAFKRTLDLREPACFGCTQLLRQVIIDSLQNIYNELKPLSSGVFSKKRYKVSLLMAKDTLSELKGHISGNKAIPY